MTRFGYKTSTTTGALILLTAVVAHAGYRLTDKHGSTTLVAKGKVKEVPAAKDAPESVFDLGNSRAWMSNPQKKVYWEGTIEELCTSIESAMSGMKKTIADAMTAQMAKMPPEQRAKMEEMKKQMGIGADAKTEPTKPAEVNVERTDEVITIAGQQARKYKVLVDGKLTQESWLSTDPALSKEFALDKASAAMGRVASCANRSNIGRATFDESQVYQKLYLQGWPLKTVLYARGQALTPTETEKIERQDIADSEFAPPKGFRKTTLEEVMFAAMKRSPGKGEAPR